MSIEAIPAELWSQIERLAESDNIAPGEEAIRLLNEAIQHRRGSGGPDARRASVQEMLDRLARLRTQIQPDASGPSVVELLREDRER